MKIAGGCELYKFHPSWVTQTWTCTSPYESGEFMELPLKLVTAPFILFYQYLGLFKVTWLRKELLKIEF